MLVGSLWTLILYDLRLVLLCFYRAFCRAGARLWASLEQLAQERRDGLAEVQELLGHRMDEAQACPFEGYTS